MRRSQIRPIVEMMEGRTLLSGVTAVVAHPAAVASTQVALNGSASGTMTAPLGNSVTTTTLSGSASFGSLGTVSLGGSLSNSVIASGKGSGTLVLSNASGSVTIQMTRLYPPHSSANVLPYSFKILSGTGTYAGAQGQGTASLTQILPPGSISGGTPRFSIAFASN